MFGTPSYEEQANLLRMEFDARAPKVRLSLVAYMLENDMGPHLVSPEKFAEYADLLVGWVTSGLPELADDIAQFEGGPDQPNLLDAMVEDQSEGDGYL